MRNATNLDAWWNPETDVRIAVEYWNAQEPVDDQFVQRPKELKIVWNYFWRVGPLAVLRKIRSRLAEGSRNKKIAGVGVGCILDAPTNAAFAPGQRVIFFAPNHSADWPRVCLDVRLISRDHRLPAREPDNTYRKLPTVLRRYSGWSPYSGTPLDMTAIQAGFQQLVLESLSTAPLGEVNTAKPSAINGSERFVGEVSKAERPTAVLFGLGNYAKTQILPHIRRHLRLAAIHEVDPDQVESVAKLGVTLDTKPGPREGDNYDAWFIAGFHHTHAPLATQALESGAYAVVEKPLVTTWEQFDKLERALTRSRAPRLFTCYQKRYSRMSDWARIDLAVPGGEAIDMHSIVFEIPLPSLHWYNWPNSGSRLISNGCHWLDYFLYMNNFSPVCEMDARALRGGDLLASVRLDNGAQLTMSITETGSQRLGMRDVIELRAKDVTVRLIDATFYEAENTAKVLRRRRVNPMEAYGRMYDSICRRIVASQDGDSAESLRSATLMLGLEDALKGKSIRVEAI